MEHKIKEQWDNRYSADDYIYGIEPNSYFKSIIDSLKPGSLLLPGEGEGRNAVYAASKGWKVTAYDISTEGRKKAMALAKANNTAPKTGDATGKSQGMANHASTPGAFFQCNFQYLALSAPQKLEAPGLASTLPKMCPEELGRDATTESTSMSHAASVQHSLTTTYGE